MKKKFAKISIVTVVFISLSCNDSPKNDKGSESPLEDTSRKESTDVASTNTANHTDFAFEPAVSTISGKIITETFYGPPGYGENPKTDTKEMQYLLLPDNPINVIAQDEKNESKYKVSKIQLLNNKDAINISKHLGSTVVLTGTFFSAHTGHHHTEVLMDVTSIK